MIFIWNSVIILLIYIVLMNCKIFLSFLPSIIAIIKRHTWYKYTIIEIWIIAQNGFLISSHVSGLAFDMKLFWEIHSRKTINGSINIYIYTGDKTFVARVLKIVFYVLMLLRVEHLKTTTETSTSFKDWLIVKLWELFTVSTVQNATN